MAQENLTHWKKLINPDFMGAYCFQPDEEKILTVASVRHEMVTGNGGVKKDCVVVRFKESGEGIKPMVFNATNCKTMTKLYGTEFIEHWVGKKVQIYVAEVNAFGSLEKGLRIRPIVPKSGKPSLHSQHPKWLDAIKSLRSGAVDMDWIKENYILTVENETRLLKEAMQDA